jgi:hypothetical protein
MYTAWRRLVHQKKWFTGGFLGFQARLLLVEAVWNGLEAWQGVPENSLPWVLRFCYFPRKRVT